MLLQGRFFEQNKTNMAHSYESSIEEELTCSICYELFVDPNTPKELNCPHVVCELCVEKIIAQGVLECPECRVITELPKDGVDALKTNYRVRNLAEKHQKFLESQQQPLDLSLDDDEQFNLPSCHRHEGKKLQYICETCDETVCHECVSINHCDRTKHEVKTVNDAQKYQLKNVEMKFKDIETIMFECQAMYQELGISEEKIACAISTSDMIIEAAAAEAKMKVDIHCAQLKAEVRKRHDPKLQKILREKSILQNKIMELQQALKLSNVSAGSNLDLRQTKILYEYLTAVRERQDNTVLVQYHPDDVKFEANQLVPQLGFIKYEERSDTTKVIMIRHIPRKLQLNSEITGFQHGIANITSNKNGTVIAVSEWSSNQVHIYFKQNIFQYKKVLSLTVPDDYGTKANFVAIAADGRIYVARDRGIHMYSASGVYQKVLHVCSEHVTNCIFVHYRCIATTQDGRIIVANYAKSAVVILTSDGDVLKSIPARDRPNYITVINDSQVAVGYLWQRRIVHVINLDSGLETCSITLKCAYSLAICYDEESNSLLVTGRDKRNKGNYVIEQYSLTTGYFIARIAHGLRRPMTMTFAGNDTLLACHDNRIKVYSVQD